MEPFEGDSSPRLSMRQKSALKRRITREHNSNFRAGYININEQYLHKTGIRGRKRYFLYCIVALLCLLAIINGLLTAGIIYFLRITPQHGMDVMEYVPDINLIRILGNAVFDTMQTRSRIGSRANKDLIIEAHNGSVVLTGTGVSKKSSSLKLDPDLTSFEGIDSFIVQNSRTGADMFSIKPDAAMVLNGDVKNLRASEVYVYNISNIPSIPNLNIESIGAGVNLTGSEGVELSSPDGNVTFSSQKDNLSLESEHGSLILDAASFVRLNVDHIPMVKNPNTQGPLTYKLCVCIPQGKVFAIAVTGPLIGCENAGGDGDPCK